MSFDRRESVVFRGFPATVAMIVGLASSGCSFAFSRGPSTGPTDGMNGAPRKCSTSIGPPILDTVLVGTHLGSGVWALTQPKETFGGSSELRTGAIVADMALAAIHLASAIHGYSAASSCITASARVG